MARREDTTRPDFEFCVMGSPVSARARNSLLLRKWTASVGQAARAAWPAGQPPLQGDVSLRVTHYADRRIADRDHMIKPIEESLHGIAIANDSRITGALWNWRDINGRFTVRFVSLSLASALSDGGEFLHIRLWSSPGAEDRG
jgi:hypothetical protein